jgi:hypothetical protein
VVLSPNGDFTTLGNRGSGWLVVNLGRVKGGSLLWRPLLKSILCHDDIYMLLYKYLLIRYILFFLSLSSVLVDLITVHANNQEPCS